MMGRGIKIKSAISEPGLSSIIGRWTREAKKNQMKGKKIGYQRRNGGTIHQGRTRERGGSHSSYVCGRAFDPSNPAASFACVL